jgi:hypothetical protein
LLVEGVALGVGVVQALFEQAVLVEQVLTLQLGELAMQSR